MVVVLSCCHPALWILDQVRNDVTSWPAGTQRGVFHPFSSGLRIKSAMTWLSWPAGALRGVSPALWFPAFAGMTVSGMLGG